MYLKIITFLFIYVGALGLVYSTISLVCFISFQIKDLLI